MINYIILSTRGSIINIILCNFFKPILIACLNKFLSLEKIIDRLSQHEFNKIIFLYSKDFYNLLEIKNFNYYDTEIIAYNKSVIKKISSNKLIKLSKRFNRPLNNKIIERKSNSTFSYIEQDASNIQKIIKENFDSFCKINLFYYSDSHDNSPIFSFGKKPQNLSFVFDIVCNKIDLSRPTSQVDYELYFNITTRQFSSPGGNHRIIATILTKGYYKLYPKSIIITN